MKKSVTVHHTNNVYKHKAAGTRKHPGMFNHSRKLTSSAASTLSRMVSQQDLVHKSVFLFTDGSCLGNRNVATSSCPAGWGVVVVKYREEVAAKLAKIEALVNVHEPQTLISQLTQDKCDVVAELFGPVVVSTAQSSKADSAADDDQDLGVDVASNNTGELCAMAKAMLYVKKSVSPLPRYCFILYDSEYAAKSITGEYNGPKNRKLIEKSRKIKASVEQMMRSANGTEDAGVVFVKVKAHNNNHFNDIADRLANMGSAGNAST